jgi:hypothetical protein
VFFRLIIAGGRKGGRWHTLQCTCRIFANTIKKMLSETRHVLSGFSAIIVKRDLEGKKERKEKLSNKWNAH